MRRATRCFGRGSPSPCATRLPKLSCHEEHAGSCPLCENPTASTTVERCDILIVRRVCAGFASSGFKATALTDNERERGQSDHAGQYGVPSSEAQSRLPAHRLRSIPCPHAPSTCGRLAVDAEIELESAIADAASFAKASGRTSR